MDIITGIFYFVLINLTVVMMGYLLVKKKQVLPGWIMLVVTIGVVYFIFRNAHPVIRMLTIIATTFTGMKVIAVTQSYKNKKLTLKFYHWLAFAIGWAGMRAEPFETLGAKPLPNAGKMVWFGISRVITGILLILLAHIIVQLPLNHQLIYVIVSATLLIGLSFILHFGLLSISAGMWRFSGVNTYYLFRKPAKSLSISEFWSKRWNLAFTEMTSITVFRPLKNKIGSAWALMAAFAFSGLLHELVITIPVNNGYGLPMQYFLIQGGIVLIEKLLNSNNILFLKNKVIARVWVFFWLVVPIPLLFSQQFLKEIIWAVMQFGVISF